MSLLDEIVAGCTSGAPLTDLLLKCKVLAAKLKHQEFADWVSSELNGYKDVASLPEYRKRELGGLVGTFQSRTHITSGLPIPVFDLPDDFHDKLLDFNIPDPVASLESADPNKRLGVQWTAEDLIRYNQCRAGALHGSALIEANAEVPQGTFPSILGIVRARILDFVLAIQAENPDAGEAKLTGPLPVPPPALTQIFNTTIHGGQAIVGSSGGQNAVGDGNVQHSGTGDIQVGGRISQADYRKALGDLLAAVTAIRGQLDAIHADLFEYASDIVIKLRKLQLDGLTIPEVESKVAQLLADDGEAKAFAQTMKGGALKRGVEILGTGATVANHPLAKAIVAGVLAGLGLTS